MSRIPALRAVTVMAAIAMAMLAAPASAQDQTVDVELGDFYIDMQSTIEAGTITFSMTNVGQMPHTIAIEGEGINVSGDILSAGQTGTLVVDLEPGTYVVYCPVPGHREAGMELTLTVTGAAEPTATVAAPTATVAAPTATVAGPTATVGTGATPTQGAAATATALPDLPRTGAGGADGMGAGTTGILLLIIAIAGLGVAGTLAYRHNR